MLGLLDGKMRGIYKILRIINDLSAIFRGKVAQRIARRFAGRAFGKGIMRRIK